MLRHLHIHNLAVVEEASIDFGPGLNVLTGATGAGKSIVIDSMALLCGGRARSDLIRAGEDLMVVSGVFDALDGPARMVLEEAGVETGADELVLRREVSREGRNRVFIDDRPVTLRLLSELAPFILRIHTQREELGLVSPELQRFWVDRSGGSEAVDLLEATRRCYGRWRELEERRQRLIGNERLRLERIDLLGFQRSEIDAAGLAPGEDGELTTRRDQLRHRESIQRALGRSFDLLSEREGAVIDGLAASQRALGEIEEWEPRAVEWQAELEEARLRVEEVAKTLGEGVETVASPAAELDEVESRLAAIDRLRRKYGDSCDEILEYREAIQGELDELESSEEEREILADKVEAAVESYREVAEELSLARRRWGETLAAGIEHELADLAMERARLEIQVTRRWKEDSPLRVDSEALEFGPEGFDRVDIHLQANPGEQGGPLAKVASGGELSRVYLALQLAAGDTVAARPTLIFDEVDAGIGGSEAAALGGKLRRLSDCGQILAVTHLPQVASAGHLHFQVAKSLQGERTLVEVNPLLGEERVEEIARMLSGEQVTARSKSNAEELLQAAGAGE